MLQLIFKYIIIISCFKKTQVLKDRWEKYSKEKQSIVFSNFLDVQFI